MTTDVSVIRTGAANLASVLAALGRLGADATVTDSPSAVAAASAVVLPGVGAFAPARERLAATGLDRVLVERVAAGRPLLAVCLGLQLLFDGSEEAGGVEGLGLARGTARRFTDVPRVPQLGWNAVTAPPGARWLRDQYAYYANSFRVVEPPPGWRVATSSYGGDFVAAIEKDAVLACQFHPELSGRAGAALLSRWLNDAAKTRVADLETETC